MGPRIAVLDSGVGNVRSVVRALEHAGANAEISHNRADMDRAAAIVLPGDGTAAAIMEAMRKHDLVAPTLASVKAGKPLLGVCLGLQALLTYSDEGGRQDCLDLIAGGVHKFPSGLKVPQIGWNQVHHQVTHPLLEGIPSGAFFYFMHSFYAQPDDDRTVIGTTDYGIRYPTILGRDNIFATQFHPEKSGVHGLKLYANFVRQVAAGCL